MEFTIQGNPDFGDLTVYLNEGEKILCESGAMSRMSRDLELKTRLMGGFFRALVRKMFGGESFFLGEYTAPRDGCFVSFAPAVPGSVIHRKIKEGDTFNLTAGSFLACSPGIQMKTKFGGLKAFFSGEGAFLLQISGQGDLFFNCYGGLVEKTINGTFTVDTGHVVAWEPTLEYSIGGMGSIKSTLLSGEGLVLKFRGQGKIWLQTRHIDGIAGWVSKYFF